jgi:hypothetical protein
MRATVRTILCSWTIATFAITLLAYGQASHQADHPRPQLGRVTSPDKAFEVRYPASLLVCAHRDGENPDVWSPKECAADIPVCDSSGHAENVLSCLAYPMHEFQKSNLQAAAFSVSRLDNLSAEECQQKWPRANTSNLHTEQIGNLTLHAASAQESANNYVSEQLLYRIAHKGACYELDVSLTTALDAAFAVEDLPRKLTSDEHEKVKNTLLQALRGFRFLR